MKLLLKHLLRSIKRKPLQPIILVVTLTLSISTTIFSFSLDDMITDNVESTQAIKYGNSGFVISVGNSSDSRFLFVEDVIDVLGESVSAVGCYELPLILESTGDTTIAMATEFERVSDVFSIEFLEYGKVTKGSVSDVAFISADLATEKGLSIGDTIEVETMGYVKKYRVEGISKHPFLASYNVMVDISSVVREFADQSLLFAAIGDDFKPCGKIYVNLDRCEDMNEEEAVALLKADDRFSEHNFENILNTEKNYANSAVLDAIVKSSVILSALLSAVISFFCLYILANERYEENLILAYSGATPAILGLMQYAEVILYWIISVPLGILLSIPTTKLITHFVKLKYTEISIYTATAVKSVFIILAVCLLTTSAFVFANKRLKKTGKNLSPIKLRWIVCLLGTISVLLTLLYIMPSYARLTLYVISMAAIITLIFLATPIVLRWIATFADKKMHNVQKTSLIALRYALKNICSLKFLHNIAILCALIVNISLTICFVFTCAAGWTHSWQHLFNADYIVYNATDKCYEKTLTCESADSVYRVYLNQSDLGTVISANDIAAFDNSLSIEHQPHNNQALITTGVSHKLDLREGDSFFLELNGTKYELAVDEIVQVSVNYIAVNCEDLGIPYTMLLVDGKDNVSSSDLLADLSKTTATELASISSVQSLLDYRIQFMDIYVNTGKVLLFVFLIFSLIGIINVFYESLRARRGEFELYLFAGSSIKNLRIMKFSELIIAVMLGVLVGLVAFILSAIAINRGFSGLGAEIFLGTMQFFLSLK